MRNFRLASRELFNNHYLNLPYENKLVLDELFFDVEDALFESLILLPTGIPRAARYGDVQPDILVKSARAVRDPYHAKQGNRLRVLGLSAYGAARRFEFAIHPVF